MSGFDKYGQGCRVQHRSGLCLDVLVPLPLGPGYQHGENTAKARTRRSLLCWMLGQCSGTGTRWLRCQRWIQSPAPVSSSWGAQSPAPGRGVLTRHLARFYCLPTNVIRAL